MSALLWMFSASFFVDFSNAALLPYVTLDPDWRTIFKGEQMSLTCNVYSSGWKNEKFYWYKNNQSLNTNQQTFTIRSAKMRDSGNYQCKTASSSRSDPVRLDVSDDWLILQAPSYIHEGDKLTLNCHGWDTIFSSEVLIYKDNQKIENTDYYINNPRSGKYKCTRKRMLSLHQSKEIYVHVNELFSAPVLKLWRTLISEGDDMTLRCDTTLAPRRRTTQLHFTFYRNEQKVQELFANDEYRVSPAQLEHSGKYSCKVSASYGTVSKTSNVLSIQVQELFRTPVMQVFPSVTGSKEQKVELRCVTTSPAGSHLLYGFLKDSHVVRDYTMDNTYLIPLAGEEHIGSYQCTSTSANHKVLKYSKEIVVKIGVDEPRITLIPERVVVGDEIALRCESSMDDFPVHYRFYHNGTILGNVTIKQRRTVEIRQIIKSVTMTGPYYCDSRNNMSSVIQIGGAVNLFITEPVENISITMEKDEDFGFGDRPTEPPNRSFPDQNVQGDDNILEQSLEETIPLGESNTLFIVLGVVLSTVLTAVLGFMYRQRITSLFNSWALQQLKTGRTKDQARVTQNPANDIREGLPHIGLEDYTTTKDQARIAQNQANDIRKGSSDIGLEDYSNIPSSGHFVCEDVCYAHIDVNQTSSHPYKENEEFSVTYSAVKSSQSTMDLQTTQETPDGTNLYQNFNKKRLQS